MLNSFTIAFRSHLKPRVFEWKLKQFFCVSEVESRVLYSKKPLNSISSISCFIYRNRNTYTSNIVSTSISNRCIENSMTICCIFPLQSTRYAKFIENANGFRHNCEVNVKGCKFGGDDC